jgi:hypothetical protein
LETIKPSLTKDEEVLWEGKPAKGAKKEEFLFFWGLISIILIILNSVFIFLAIRSFFSNSGSNIFVICFIFGGIDALLFLLLIVAAKERSFGALSYLITSKRAYVLASSTLRQKVLKLKFFDFDTEWIPGQGDFFYIPLKKIHQINIRANTGIRESFGLLGYDVFISRREPFGLGGTYIFAQISEISALVNVLMHTLGFCRKESAFKMECYVHEEDSHVDDTVIV